MEQLWSLGLYHGDLKSKNAMKYVTTSGETRTIVIDVAPHSLSSYVPGGGTYTPDHSIWSYMSSLKPQVQAQAYKLYNLNKNVSPHYPYYNFANPIANTQAERLAIGYDMHSITCMIAQHINANRDLYSPDQLQEWQEIVDMNLSVDKIHSIEYLNALRTFIENNSTYQFGSIAPEVSRYLPSLSTTTSGLPVAGSSVASSAVGVSPVGDLTVRQGPAQYVRPVEPPTVKHTPAQYVRPVEPPTVKQRPVQGDTLKNPDDLPPMPDLPPAGNRDEL